MPKVGAKLGGYGTALAVKKKEFSLGYRSGYPPSAQKLHPMTPQFRATHFL